jgi:hypothetical protein
VKPVVGTVAVAAAGGVAGLFLLPLLVAAVIAGQLQATSQLAEGWDIPAELVPVLAAAGQQAGISWFLLAGVASVATDFARHAPDGVGRGQAPGTAIDPDVVPPIITASGGAGMFLVDARQATAAVSDLQDVRATASWLAARLATLVQGTPLAGGSLEDPAVDRIWQAVLATAPVVIASVAPGGPNLAPVDPGANPIRQFGAAVMTAIGAGVTAANLDAFAAWAAGEGTCARFNPLATTQPEPGATAFNTLSGGGHVWNYPSPSVGVAATTTALTNGRYQPVIDAFLASAGVDAVASAVERSPWGTKHFGSPSYAGATCAGETTPPPSLPTVVGPDAVPATIVARAANYERIWTAMEALAPNPAPFPTP